MTDVLQATRRQSIGTTATRRLRQTGQVPAVLYGHGQANEHLALPAVQVKGLLRHHSKTVQLSGDVNETALVSDMQWDSLGIEVLHLDLIRVNLQESVELSVPVRLHGEAIGVREGGVLLENHHEVEIRCPAGSIPEYLVLEVADLKLGQHLTAAKLKLPGGVELVTAPETVLAHVEAPRGGDEVTSSSIGVEPEVISKGLADKSEE